MQSLGEFLAQLSRRYAPDAFVFALLLTAVVFGLALVLTDHGPRQLVLDWYGGFWDLLSFSMQMVLILVTGYGLASSPPVRRLLGLLAEKPRTGPQGVALVALVAGLLGCLNWGLSLVAGALLAREVAVSGRLRGIQVHYPLVAAAGYVGQLVWHGGLSGSAPLVVNTQGHFLEGDMGRVLLSETLFRPFNFFVTLGILVVVPLILMSLHPRSGKVRLADLPESESVDGSEAGRPTRSSRLEDSRALVWLVGLAGVIVLIDFFRSKGLLGLDLNIVNFTLLLGGLILHGTPGSYAKAIVGGVRASSGVILQFPFYAGIMGMMTASGLAGVIAGWFVSISTPVTYPFWTLLSAGLINLAVPSGGGQWAVQGPILLEATGALGVDLGRNIMAMSYGDELTNMIQPFWALPLLGITRLRAGDILGYTAVPMVAALLIMVAGLLFLP